MTQCEQAFELLQLRTIQFRKTLEAIENAYTHGKEEAGCRCAACVAHRALQQWKGWDNDSLYNALAKTTAARPAASQSPTEESANGWVLMSVGARMSDSEKPPDPSEPSELSGAFGS